MNGVFLSKPKGWVDRSMIAYALPDSPDRAVAPNLVITQSDFGDVQGTTAEDHIEAFALQQIKKMKSGLPDLVVHEQKGCVLCDRASYEVYLSWQTGRVRVTQWVIFTARDDRNVIICTATAAETDFSEFHDQFRDKLIGAIRLG